MQIKIKIVSCHTADSKPVKQEVNSTVKLTPLIFPGSSLLEPIVNYGRKKFYNIGPRREKVAKIKIIQSNRATNGMLFLKNLGENTILGDFLT